MRAFPSRRRGVTLVELAFAVSLAALLAVTYFTVTSGGAREGAHLERGAELMGAATVLQEVLSWDLLRSLPIGVIEGETEARAVASPGLRLPMLAGYDARLSPSPAFQVIEYRFDPEKGTLSRNGSVLVAEGLVAVGFRWVRGVPDLLEVTLVGQSPFGTQGPRFVIRLPAPPAGRAVGSYRFAEHHSGGRETRGDGSAKSRALAYEDGDE
jgi:hypothetical protein